MATITNRLMPYRQYSEHDVINLYSLLGASGDAGALVKVTSGAANPSNPDGYSSNQLGATVNTLSYSFRYETKLKVEHTASGDDSFAAIGILLWDVRETDENGLPLRYFPQRAKEILAVISGQTVPIAMRGIFATYGQYVDTSLAVPKPGFPVVPSRSGNGLLAAVDPDSANFTFGGTGGLTNGFGYSGQQVVGKWLTTSGSEFAANGGYYFYRLGL